MAAAVPLKEITDVAVTYSMAAPDDVFVRCGKIPTPCFVWQKSNGDVSQAITDVKIVHDDQNPGT